MTKVQMAAAAVIVFILGGAIGFWIGKGSGIVKTPTLGDESSNDVAAVGSGVETPQGPILTGGNAILVNDQAAGAAVSIAMVTLASDGWVAIHEDRGGKPGAILGAQRFNAGTKQSGTVELLRPTVAGGVFYAMLHADDGDKMFDVKKDMPLTDPQGSAIMMRFTATGNPAQ